MTLKSIMKFGIFKTLTVYEIIYGMGRVYVYKDEEDSIYLDWLSVHESMTKKGLGTSIQEIREDWGRIRGYKYSKLWVKRDSWQQKWYERRGYVFFREKHESKTHIWMVKNL
jgi:GNAT superfamily N-acetyltransferase